MRRWILALTLTVPLLGASLLAAPKPAAANHWALCVAGPGSPVFPVPTAFVSVPPLPPGVLCVASNCFHPGALPYSPFRPNC